MCLFVIRESGTHLCADRLTQHSIDLCVGKGTLCRSGILNFGGKRSIINPRINNENTAALVHAAGTTRPAGAAAATTPGTGNGLRCAAVSPAEGGKE